MSKHVEDAEALLARAADYGPKMPIEHQTAIVAMAQAFATLALVDQQHTANLIALLEQIPAPHGREQLHETIIARLGLA